MTTTAPPVIRAGGLTKTYGAIAALSNLTVDIPPGVVGLVGSNGAGKSTVIKILLGLLAPTSGHAQVLGLDVANQGRQIRERVGYMPEHDCLPADVSATELVVHMGRMSGLPVTAARERAADSLRLVGLYEERYRLIGGYSTGMRQRVKLAQALVHDPALILLDEPTNGLDPSGRDDMLGLIEHIGAELGISVLVTSHLLGELERVCGHLVVIEQGTLTRSASVAEATSESHILTIEVLEGPDALGPALHHAGLHVTRDGPVLEVVVTDEVMADTVRDTVARLGLGLVRMQRRRHRLAEMFTGPQAPAPQTSAHPSSSAQEVADVRS